jgi:hypothetical protein
MISDDSILRRLPIQIERKQLLFLDGMRHAGEIVCLAYSRLQSSLTKIAHEDDAAQSRRDITSAYLDVWAIVDAVDRFRLLWRLTPGREDDDPNKTRGFEEEASAIKNLRDVSDHLAQRADYIVAQNSTALGVLGWFTATIEDGSEGVICTLAPGTIQKGNHPAVNPGGRTGEFPTCMIQLSAGEYTACLSDVLPHMGKIIKGIEESISEFLRENVLDGQQAGCDIVLKMSVKAKLDSDLTS